MCGRYALALRPSQIRQMLEEDGMEVDETPEDTGDGAPRHTYNFAPGSQGVVYRANTSDQGTGQETHHHNSKASDATKHAHANDHTKFGLQSMKWGLIPSWTKRNPDFGSMLKTINCRDDSLGSPGGLWASMKARKRCVVIAQGFYEWLKVGKDKLPHYVKRKDGHLMCFAGLWDCVQYEGSNEKIYSYTIITTSSNAQLRFLHDRMPVILEPGSSAMSIWLDPFRSQWTDELQSILKPLDASLEVYQVPKDVGKVGNNSPTFVVPLDSKENKSNIKNFFENKSLKTDDVTERAHGSTEETHGKEMDTEKSEAPHATQDTRASASIKRKLEEDFEKETTGLHRPQKQRKISAKENMRRKVKDTKVKAQGNILSYLVNKS
ncbi:hypothetical protein FGRMN_2269 [Fusarium graminum]|nr:hypothetical protein FGRMN_2269 [Fusarium graminum]